MEVGVRKLRDGLSAYLEEVKLGREVVVTDHGRPIARLVPIGQRAIDKLIAQGLVQPAMKRRSPSSPVKASGRVSDLVEDQRR